MALELTIENIGFLVFALLGSVSWGYIILRLAWPDIRIIDQTRKIGASAMLGMLLAAVAVVPTYLFGQIELFALIAAGEIFIVYFVLRVAMNTMHKKHMEIGVPIPQLSLEEKKAVSKLHPQTKVALPLAAKTIQKRTKSGIEFEEVELPKIEIGEKSAVEKAMKPKGAVKEGKAGFFAGLFGKKPEKAEEYRPTASGVKEAEMLKKQAEEARLELEAKDIFPFLESERKNLPLGKPAAKGKPAQTGSRHGIWRSSGEVHEQKADEFRQQVVDIYSQMKTEKTKPGMFAPRAPRPEAPRAQPMQQEKKMSEPPQGNLSLEEVLGGGAGEEEKPKAERAIEEAVKPKPKKLEGVELKETGGQGKEDVFKQLQAIAGGEPTAKIVTLPAEQGMGCPRCHSKNVKVVFCPYCSTGFCSNCANGAKDAGDNIEYICPKCGEKVVVKK